MSLLNLLSSAPPPTYYKDAALCDNHPPALVIGVGGDTVLRILNPKGLTVPLMLYGPEPDYARKAIEERILALLDSALMGRAIPRVALSALVDTLNQQIEPLQVETLLCGNQDVLDRIRPLGLPVIEAPTLGSTVVGVPGPDHLGHDFQVEGQHGLVLFASRVAACLTEST